MSFNQNHGGGGNPGGGGGGASPMDQIQKIQQLFNRTYYLGTVLNTRIRVHLLLYILIAYLLGKELFAAGGNVILAAIWSVILFGSILLHEFGHILACRRVGGQADEILMWPLGGLAYCSPPHTAWANFVTVIWGPLVNVILAAAAFGVLLVWPDLEKMPVSLNPFSMWRDNPSDYIVLTIASLFVINYYLLLFNLALVFYPFDGGRILQSALWAKIGYGKSTYYAVRFGMVGAGIVIAVGIFSGELMLAFIGMFGMSTCYQQMQMLRYEANHGSGFAEQSYASSFEPLRPVKVKKQGPVKRWLNRRRVIAQQKEYERKQQEEAAIDRILMKVRSEGLGSLTDKEKAMLQDETDRKNKAG